MAGCVRPGENGPFHPHCPKERKMQHTLSTQPAKELCRLTIIFLGFLASFAGSSSIVNATSKVPTPAMQVHMAEWQELSNQLQNFHLRPEDLNVAFLPKRVYPIERGICGNWMDRYAVMHREILQGKRPPRYSIYRSTQSGLTDRIMSGMSTFLHALLTDRAWLYDWQGGHDLWAAYRSSYIHWKYFAPEKNASQSEMLVYDMYGSLDKQAKMQNLFWTSKLEDIGSNATYLVWTSNKAVTFNTLKNPYVHGRLRDMGLTPYTVFGCLFDFLYRPTPRTMRLFESLLPELLDPSIFKIGVQIRTGDLVLWGQHQEPPFELVYEFFGCARLAEKLRAVPGQKVLWYLITDSVQIRASAQTYLGDKVVTLQNASVHHVAHPFHHDKNAVLAYAAGEAWLFSLADIHIISSHSGFGRMGAMIACNWDSMIQLYTRGGLGAKFARNLTYVTRHSDDDEHWFGVDGKAVECERPSRTDGQAFCWPPDEAVVSEAFRQACSEGSKLEDVIATWLGVRR